MKKENRNILKNLSLNVFGGLLTVALLSIFGILAYRKEYLYGLLPMIMLGVIGFLLFKRLRARKKLRSNKKILKKYLSPYTHPLPVSIIGSSFLRRSIVHLFGEGESISLREYLNLVREPLIDPQIRLNIKRLTGTSLLSPNDWHAGEASPGFMSYLDDQIKLKRDNPKFQVIRIFILDQKDIPSHPAEHPFIKEKHLKVGFEVLICNAETIKQVSSNYVRDFAILAFNETQWVIDGEVLETTIGEREPRFRVKIEDNIDQIQALYNDIIRTLKENAVYDSTIS